VPDAVITVENLSKSYLLGHRTGDHTLRDVIGREARNFTRKAIDVFRGRQVVQGDEVEEFWALKNVSLQVKKGGGASQACLRLGRDFIPSLLVARTSSSMARFSG